MQTEETHRQRKISSISAHFLIYGIIHVLKSISWNRAQKIRRLSEREAWQSCVNGSLSEYDFDSWYCSFLTNQEKFCKYLEDACCKAIFNHLLFFVSRCILLNNSYLKKINSMYLEIKYINCDYLTIYISCPCLIAT